MTDYGVLPTGFSRKPLSVILSEVEAQLITEFGPDLIQTAASPMGQLNGTFADLVAQLWEFAEETYHSYDPDQAEGVRLDALAKIRLIERGGGETDTSFRQAITNENRGRIDIQDLTRGIQDIDGVTYVHVFVNDSNEIDGNGLHPGQVAVAVIGGDDAEISAVMRQYIVPGVSSQGNTLVSSVIDGYCRELAIIRPIIVPVTLTIDVRVGADSRDCPPPSPTAIAAAVIEGFSTGDRMLLNGDDITFFRVRSVIESRFSNVEVLSFVGERDGVAQAPNVPIVIGFIEMAQVVLDDNDVTVNVVEVE